MFLSVKERARQIANGQLTPTAAPVNEPPPKVSIPKSASKTPAKPTSPKAAPAKPTSPKVAAPKPAPAKASSSKPAPTRSATQIGAFPDAAPPKLSRSKTEPPKSPKSKSDPSKHKKRSSSKEKEKEKDTPSRPKPSRTESSKSVSSSKKTPSKSSSKSTPVTPVRSSFFSRIQASSSSSSESSTDDESPKATPSDEVTELKAACLKQVNGVTGLGKNLAVVCRQTSKKGWYAALKDTSSDKYLKLWMNREKTFPTQVEALQAYLVFAKKMKDGSRLFPMSPTK